MTERLRLLVACQGNICRSPMAEGVLRARLREAGLEGVVKVDSVGIGNWHAGEPPDRRAIACAARNAVDIADLRARQLARRDFEAFHYVLCADHMTLQDARALAPAAARDRCMLLSTYAGQGEIEIPDPYTGGPEHFEYAWDLADGMARAIVRRLSQLPTDS